MGEHSTRGVSGNSSSRGKSANAATAVRRIGIGEAPTNWAATLYTPAYERSTSQRTTAYTAPTAIQLARYRAMRRRVGRARPTIHPQAMSPGTTAAFSLL